MNLFTDSQDEGQDQLVQKLIDFEVFLEKSINDRDYKLYRVKRISDNLFSLLQNSSKKHISNA